METLAHWQRVGVLVSRLYVDSAVFDGDNAVEVCTALDEAVEFAALEGISVAAAMREFVDDVTGPLRIDLERLLIPDTAHTPTRLPVMPKAAARLLRTTDESTSARELKDIAGSDPALAAALLCGANSARFGSRFEISGIRDAVMRLGVPEARKIMLASWVARVFASRPLQELWHHSQLVANSACELAAMCGADPEAAYLAGLLHDIGRLGFSTFPAQLRVAEQDWLTAGFPAVYAESIVYGKDHAAFGAELLRDWALPAAIVEAVELHHRPETSRSGLCAVLFLAEDLVSQAAGTPVEDLWPTMRRQVALDTTGITPERLNTNVRSRLSLVS